jgi:tRNA-Thr(GGU) m(6)t(6)A37 methyltransferase TsaA
MAYEPMLKDQATYNLKARGWIRAEFKQKFGTPRQGSLAKHSRAQVELAPEWKGRGILNGLEGFSHVWILSYLHLSISKRQRGKVHPPRLKGKKIGVMGSRSPHRPNNIGLTLARVISCEGDRLELAEVDLVDGTPVLDLKPYIASADRPETFTGGWTDTVVSNERECDFSPEALGNLTDLTRKKKIKDPTRLRELIHEMIKQDPRPPAYWDREDAMFAVWVAGLNVSFRFHEERFTVTGVEESEGSLSQSNCKFKT